MLSEKKEVSQASQGRPQDYITFKKIDALEVKKIEIVSKVRRKSKNAKDLVENGMTMKDVMSLLGTPDGSYHGSLSYSPNRWYYGTTVIYFNDGGVVTK